MAHGVMIKLTPEFAYYEDERNKILVKQPDGDYLPMAQLNPAGTHFLHPVSGAEVELGSNGAKGDTGADSVVAGPPGNDGAQGNPGDPGAQGDPGAVGATWLGAWDVLSNYTANVLVSYEGSTWISLQGHIGETPMVGAFWDVLAQGGAAGADGVDGIPGGAIAEVTSGTIDGAVIGGVDPASGRFTTFGCNGVAAQGPKVVSASAIDIATALVVVNQLRTMLLANGIAVEEV